MDPYQRPAASKTRVKHTRYTSTLQASDGCFSACRCHLEPASGLDNWFVGVGGGGGVPLNHRVTGNRQLGGRPPVTSTNSL